jgi:hypothetical protein
MGFNFNFREVGDRKDLNMLVDFLMKQSLNYPNYEDWVQRAECEIDTGYKRTVLAFSNNCLVGDIIYQPHKEIPRVRQLKNVRVHPDVRNRYFAKFMLRQAEFENGNEYDSIVVDAPAERQDIVSFFISSGYKPVATKHLYDETSEDIILVKSLHGCFPAKLYKS